MSEKSNIQRMLNEQHAYQGKLAPDPIENRGPARSGPDGPPKLTVPQHLKDTGTVAGAAETRARLAEQDRNLHGVPPAPHKP